MILYDSVLLALTTIERLDFAFGNDMGIAAIMSEVTVTIFRIVTSRNLDYRSKFTPILSNSAAALRKWAVIQNTVQFSM